MLPRCILRLIELFDPHAIEYGKFVVMHECRITINCCLYLFTVFSTFLYGQVRKNPSTPIEEHLNISKIAKFESDLLKTNKDIAP